MSVGSLARSTGLYDLIEPWYARRQQGRWQASGRPIPAPSAVKRQVLLSYANVYGLRTLVETGTFKADTVRGLRNHFDAIHSVEIDEALYEAAQARCRRQTNAHLHLGDSEVLLPTIVESLTEPALFWLDAHFSGGVTGGDGGQPIVAEVRAVIEADANHVLLIDDVREFGIDEDYPAFDAIRGLIGDAYRLEVRDDLARLTPA